MKFYFCEGCGTRITEGDIAAGLGKDKKLKGVFCKDCAVGITTLEGEALSNKEALKLLAQTGEGSAPKPASSSSSIPPRRATSATRIPPASRPGRHGSSKRIEAAGGQARTTPKASGVRRASAPMQAAPSNTKTIVITAGTTAVLVILGLILFLGGDSSPRSGSPKARKKKGEATSVASSNRPAPPEKKGTGPAPPKPIPQPNPPIAKKPPARPEQPPQNTPVDSKPEPPARTVTPEPKPAVKNTSPPSPPKEERPFVFLSEIPAFDVKVGFLKSTGMAIGSYNHGGHKRIVVNGEHDPHNLLMHPPTNGFARARFRLNKRFNQFAGMVGICDFHGVGQVTALTYEVLGDGEKLWKSRPLKGRGNTANFSVDVSQVDILTIRVHCPGRFAHCFAAWAKPRLYYSGMKIDTKALAAELKKQGGGMFKLSFHARNDFSRAIRSESAHGILWNARLPAGVKPGAGIFARWRGMLVPPETGAYTFELKSANGSYVAINDVVVFATPGTAGQHTVRSRPIQLEKGKSYEITADVPCRKARIEVALKWARDGEEMKWVKADSEVGETATGTIQPGWTAEYALWGQTKPSTTRRELMLQWNWGTVDPMPGIRPVKFWSRHTCVFSPPEDGDYRFHLTCNGETTVHINKMTLMEVGKTGATQPSIPVALEKSKTYRIQVFCQVERGPARCMLDWSSARQTKPTPVIGNATGEPTGGLKEGFLVRFSKDGKTKLERYEAFPEFDWSHRGIPEVGNDDFQATYEGWVTPPADGLYEFILDYDEGVRFYLDDILLLERWHDLHREVRTVGPIQLKKGKRYKMKLRYREVNGEARLKVTWRSKQMKERLLTGMRPDRVNPKSKEVGHLKCALLAEYRDKNGRPLQRRLEGTTHCDWGKEPPHGNCPKDGYTVKWHGMMKVPVSGKYGFRLEANDKGTVRLQKRLILNGGLRKDAVTTQTLVANKPYYIEIEYTEDVMHAAMKLTWKPPGKTEFEEIPAWVWDLPDAARRLVK